ncbi:MAG: response regulator transcription factor [Chitinophagaceae bacterium]|nr:response regulator transcription factor [Chitinophagaceae bacterium]
MNILIIEDESLSAEHLSNLIYKVEPNAQILGIYDSVKSSVKAFQDGLTADLLFLDIHLADGLGFDIFKTITPDIPVIFTTAYDEYAIKAFQLNSVDYLLKPLGIEDLRRAFEKFHKFHQPLPLSILSALQQNYTATAKTWKSRFMVKSGQSIDSIPVEEVLHFYTVDSVTFLVRSNGKRYPIDYTLDQLVELLNPDVFFRINRKVILHMNAIQKVNTHFNSRLLIHSSHLEGDMALVSRERVGEFKAWLDR